MTTISPIVPTSVEKTPPMMPSSKAAPARGPAPRIRVRSSYSIVYSRLSQRREMRRLEQLDAARRWRRHRAQVFCRERILDGVEVSAVAVGGQRVDAPQRRADVDRPDADHRRVLFEGGQGVSVSLEGAGGLDRAV